MAMEFALSESTEFVSKMPGREGPREKPTWAKLRGSSGDESTHLAGPSAGTKFQVPPFPRAICLHCPLIKSQNRLAPPSVRFTFCSLPFPRAQNQWWRAKLWSIGRGGEDQGPDRKKMDGCWIGEVLLIPPCLWRSQGIKKLGRKKTEHFVAILDKPRNLWD